MKIEDRIKQHLSTHGKVVVPNLGTFVASPSSARMKDSQGVMHPPTLEIKFSDDMSDVADESIAKWLLKEGDVSADDLKFELESFTKGIKNNVSLHGKGELKGLGYFTKASDGGLEFVQDDEVVLGPDNFGLPKIEAKPLTPAVVSKPLPEPSESNKLLMAAIAIPLVVFFCLFIYLLTNRPAYEKLVSYLSGTTPPVELVDNSEKEKEKAAELEAANRAKMDSIKAAMDASKVEDSGKTGGTSAGKTDNKATETDSEKTTSTSNKTTDTNKTTDNASKPKTDTGASTDLVVSNKTNRFYVIIGSYSDVESAKKAALKCRKIGYKTAKVVNVGGRIRVSLQDFANKPDASTFSTKAGKDYAGAWVFAN